MSYLCDLSEISCSLKRTKVSANFLARTKLTSPHSCLSPIAQAEWQLTLTAPPPPHHHHHHQHQLVAETVRCQSMAACCFVEPVCHKTAA